MRRLLIPLISLLLLTAMTVGAQTRTFTRDDVEYILELPSPLWQAVSVFDVHNHLEFIYKDETVHGRLHLRKRLVTAGTTALEIYSEDEKRDFQRLPGYVACSECNGEIFQGQLPGLAFSYEYVSGGQKMAGRIYYLQVDKRTFYSLRFTFSRDKFQELRRQMDMMAGSFHLK